MRYTLRETWSGLKRNASMTLAVVVTMWVSLSLFGSSIMTIEQVNKMKDRWYDKIEISIFLCNKDSASDGTGGNCTPGQDVTESQRALIRAHLDADANVQTVYYESKQQAYDSFRQTYQGSPILESLSVDQMQDSFRVKLRDPQNYQGLVAQAAALPGVQAVQDLHTVLDPLFSVLNALKWGALGMSGLLLVAAALQIGNTIRVSAFTRRREIAIMRLVGAGNAYILLPFLLESLVAGLLGVLLSCGSLAAIYRFVIEARLKVLIEALSWIDWPQVGVACGGVAIVGVALSIIPTLIATRKYLRT